MSEKNSDLGDRMTGELGIEGPSAE